MRCLEKNEQQLYYALYLGKTMQTDSDGNKTGEYTKTYSNPYSLKANISASKGIASLEPMGIHTNYGKKIVTDWLSCPIDEYSRLWIGKEPYVESVLQPHNYVVTSVSKSFNHVTITAEEVDA